MEWKHQGAVLRYVRKSRGLSQTELAQAVYASQPLIANIEAGRRNLTPKLALAICDVLKIRPIVLVNEDFLEQDFASQSKPLAGRR